MLIKLKNKDTLQFDEFVFKCTIGKKGISSKKKEGDLCTPKGTFSIKNLYYRSDRLVKPQTKIIIKKIKKNMGWCNDTSSAYYNKEIQINKKVKHEKLYRHDYKYDLFILVKYNYLKVKKNKGSAIFIHLTKNYKATSGCIAVSKKDFLILSKMLKKNSQIIID